jgi:hypothetical protein
MRFPPNKPITNCAQCENNNHPITAHVNKTQSLRGQHTEHNSQDNQTSNESTQHTKHNDNIKQIYVSTNLRTTSTLTNYPFIQRRTNTMTSTSDIGMSENVATTAKKQPSTTLLAIVKSISDKINKKTIKTPNSDNTIDTYRTMPIKANKQSPTLLRIPRSIPPPPMKKYDINKATSCLPLTTTNQQGTFDKKRILTAILHAFQQTYPESHISPKIQDHSDDSGQYKNLHRAEDIPNDQSIDNYLETPINNSSGQFCARILMNCTDQLHIVKRSKDLIGWLKKRKYNY